MSNYTVCGAGDDTWERLPHFEGHECPAVANGAFASDGS